MGIKILIRWVLIRVKKWVNYNLQLQHKAGGLFIYH